MITSYDKSEFVIGKTYWTYYMGLSNKGNKLKDYCEPFQVIPTGVRMGCDDYFEWEILNGKFSETMKHNITTFMNGYGFASCNFFETKQECVEDHNKRIIEHAKYLNTSDRDAMYKKLVGYKPETPKIEKDSLSWMNTLTAEQKEYLRWIKDYYEGEI